MEIKELESFYINEASQTLDVTFRILSDNEDEIRTDQIDLTESKTFGYDLTNQPSSDFFDDEEYEDIFDDDDETELDEEEIISFLNEYYLIYPNKLPNTQLY
jgi:hypothetical protein